ncbi:MAG: hypothetical protein H6842_09235 [Rhodospirillaceae bacterium]|nr:hypothetical protein [Rhodospirillaceae bacterium]
MFALMAWIGAVTGIPPAPDVPAVMFNSAAELQRLHSPDAAYLDPADGDGSPQAVALYNPLDGTLHLPEGWQADDPVDISILLHELVHHMQSRAGMEYACRAEMEKAAYDAQIAFLASMGMDMFEVMEMNELFYRIITNCALMQTY